MTTEALNELWQVHSEQTKRLEKIQARYARWGWLLFFLSKEKEDSYLYNTAEAANALLKVVICLIDPNTTCQQRLEFLQLKITAHLNEADAWLRLP